MLEAKI